MAEGLDKAVEEFSKLSTTDMARTVMCMLRNADPAFMKMFLESLSPEERFNFQKLNEEITDHPENFK